MVKHIRNILPVVLVLMVATGCTGMRMDPAAIRVSDSSDASIEKSYQENLRLIPITASLIVQNARKLTKQPPSELSPEFRQAAADYQVGAQDVLQVTVWDHPELTTPAGQFRDAADSGNLVRKDGTIFYPYIGVVQVAGKTLEEIRLLLAKKLAKYIKDPQVDVRVAAYRSQRVYVTGEVVKAGMQPITDAGLRVLEAIQVAGGARIGTGTDNSSSADLQHVKLNRQGKTYTIDVQSMLFKGNMDDNIALQNGDILHVPDNFDNKVFVMGEVKKPSSVQMLKGRMTLAEALAEVGGVDMATSNPGQVYVIRGGDLVQKQPVSSKPAIFQLDARSPDAMILADQFALQSHDVVFVSAAGIVRWGRVLNQLQGTIQSIALIRALAR